MRGPFVLRSSHTYAGKGSTVTSGPRRTVLRSFHHGRYLTSHSLLAESLRLARNPRFALFTWLQLYDVRQTVASSGTVFICFGTAHLVIATSCNLKPGYDILHAKQTIGSGSGPTTSKLSSGPPQTTSVEERHFGGLGHLHAGEATCSSRYLCIYGPDVWCTPIRVNTTLGTLLAAVFDSLPIDSNLQRSFDQP